MSDSPPSNRPDPPERHDTPTQRATIAQLQVDELDHWLMLIRERRLQRVKKLEAIAKVKADETRLENFIRYESLYKQAQKALAKCEAQEQKAEEAIRKCRLKVLAIMMETEDASDPVA